MGDIDRRTLKAFAANWGVDPLPVPPRLTRPSEPLRVRTSADEQTAEDLVTKIRQAAATDAKNQRSAASSLARVLTSKRKEALPHEVFAALEAHVAAGGSAGVAEALTALLISSGGNVNVVNVKSKTKLLHRRHTAESLERSRLLQQAIFHRNSQLVAVLLPHADQFALDDSLSLAINTGHIDIVGLLLRYGASISNSVRAINSFRAVCSMGNRADMVALLLAADGCPSSDEVSAAMVDAAQCGCFLTVHHLSAHKGADGSYNDAAALQHAIYNSRVDIALAILTGAKPPAPGSRPLNNAFDILFKHKPMQPEKQLVLAEILLCAGARGDVVSEALFQACTNDASEMVHLLLSYGASVEFDSAAAVRQAVNLKKLDQARNLLADGVSLDRQLASECLALLPNDARPEERLVLLSLLLRKGAAGPALNECLIDAVNVNDVASARLLLTPYFESDEQAAADDSAAPRKHAIASVDCREGLALQLAVQAANMEIVNLMIAAQPSPGVLAGAFPLLFGLPPHLCCQLVVSFTHAGLPESCATTALLEQIALLPPAPASLPSASASASAPAPAPTPAPTPELNPTLSQAPATEYSHKERKGVIRVLLDCHADVNADDGAAFFSAIANHDVWLMQTLVQFGRPSVTTLALALDSIMTTGIRKQSHLPAAPVSASVRIQMVRSLIGAGVHQHHFSTDNALVSALSMKTVDADLVGLLLKEGRANVNQEIGQPVRLATINADPEILGLLLQSNEANEFTVEHGLYALAELPPSQAKATKLEYLLRQGKPTEALDFLLVSEVKILGKTPATSRVYSVVDTLLSAGANVNAHDAAALSHAVAAPNIHLVSVLLQAKPHPDSIAKAMPRIFYVTDLSIRFQLGKLLLEAGVPEPEAGRSLNHTVIKFPQDIPLMTLLVGFTSANDGHGLLSAIRQQHVDIVQTLLAAKSFTTSVIDSALGDAMLVSDKANRRTLSSLLIQYGATERAVSAALVQAAADEDTNLASLLLSKGASIDDRDGQAIVLACRTGCKDLLHLLLTRRTEISSDTALVRGFKEAAKLDDVTNRREVFHLLLMYGLRGKLVNEQLVRSASAGDDEAELVRLLLAYGANVNYQDGKSLWAATRHGSMAVVKLLLLGEDHPDDTEVDGNKIQGVDQDKKVGTALTLTPMPTSTSTPKTTKNRDLPSQSTMTRALDATWALSRTMRYQIIQWMFASGLHASEEVDVALERVVVDDSNDNSDNHDGDKNSNRDGPDMDLVRLLLAQGASPLKHNRKVLMHAAGRYLVPVLDVCITCSKVAVGLEDFNCIFSDTFTTGEDRFVGFGPVSAEAAAPAESAPTWLSSDGWEVATLLLKGGAYGDAVSKAFTMAIGYCSGEEHRHVARRFVELFLKFKTSVNFNSGEPLQAAARLGNVDLVRQLLMSFHPTAESLAMSFPCIFDSDLPQATAVELIALFTEFQTKDFFHDFAVADGADKLLQKSDSEPLLIKALSRHPRSVPVLSALLDAGCNYDQTAMVSVAALATAAGESHAEPTQDRGAEAVSVLIWALVQPEKKISSSAIQTLVERGSNVNTVTQYARMTPLMFAIRSCRADVVQLLIEHGADVYVFDSKGQTPLVMAAQAGWAHDGTGMMKAILAAGKPLNDGSLHVAAQQTNVSALRLLVEHGLDVDFPSRLHGGRSALCEVCLHGTDDAEQRQWQGQSEQLHILANVNTVPLSARKQKALQETIKFLIESGSDPELRFDGKPALLLALEASHPVETTRALLASGLYSAANSPSNWYQDDAYTYSPTMYVKHVLRWRLWTPDTAAERCEQLVDILRIYRVEDVFYAHNTKIRQPAEAVKVPEQLFRQECERQAREEREADEKLGQARKRQNAEELALLEAQLAEKAHKQRLKYLKEQHEAELKAKEQETEAMTVAAVKAIKTRGEAEAATEALAAKKREQERKAVEKHTHRLGEEQLSAEEEKQNRRLELEKRQQDQAYDAAEKRSNLVLRERRSIERMDLLQHQRLTSQYNQYQSQYSQYSRS